LIDGNQGWEGHFGELNFLAVEVEVLILISKHERCDPIMC
jgi:hypothetical protein